MYIVFGLGIVFFYLYHLLYILDRIATCLTSILLRLNRLNREIRIIEQNLTLVLPQLTLAEREKITFQGLKLQFLNMFIALHHRIIYNFPFAMTRHYVKVNWPDSTPDLKNTIIVLPHYGIYYDAVTPHLLFKATMAPIYRITNSIVEYIVFKADQFKGKIIGISQVEFKNYLRGLEHDFYSPIDTYDMILILCDQKAHSRYHEVTFLNQPVKFIPSPVDIHKRTGRPIYAFMRRYNQEKFKIEYSLIPLHVKLDDMAPAVITQKIADLFTAEILAQPDQYLWGYNRFF